MYLFNSKTLLKEYIFQMLGLQVISFLQLTRLHETITQISFPTGSFHPLSASSPRTDSLLQSLVNK